MEGIFGNSNKKLIMELRKPFEPYYQRYYAGVQDKLEAVLADLTPIQQLFELEKIAMKIRKLNGLTINDAVREFSNKYKKQKEESNDYKR